MDKKFYLAIGTAIFFWASGNVASRIAIMSFSAEALALLRFLVGAVLIDIIAARKKIRMITLREIPLFLCMGACGYAIYIMTFNFGIATVSAGAASFIIAASPVFTALFARFLLNERMPSHGWIATIICLFGVALISLIGQDRHTGTGAVWILISVLLLSLYNTLLRRLTNRYSALEITTYSINAAAILLLIYLPGLVEDIPAADISSLLAALWTGTLTSVLAFLCWAYALQETSNINRLSNYMFFTPLVTVLLAWLILDERPIFSVWLGGALVLSGMFLMNIRQHNFGSENKGGNYNSK